MTTLFGEGENEQERAERIVAAITAVMPSGCVPLHAEFAMTVVAEAAELLGADEQRLPVRVQPTEALLELVREERRRSARAGAGPWWRLVVTFGPAGAVEVLPDYGDEPFPDEQLFDPHDYLADLEYYPRESVPIWLAAYIAHGDRQSRTPQAAAEQARTHRRSGVLAIPSDSDFPPFPVLWSRWAVLAAVHIARRSPAGPLILPAMGWFESSGHSGSTLYALPGGRAVLSGGVWNAPELAATYLGGQPMPAFYSGAPDWVADPVLNPRAANGLMSFCYWWESGHWYRGGSAPADRLREAIPEIWTFDTAVKAIRELLASRRAVGYEAVAALLAAAEIGVVTRDTVSAVLGTECGFDIDSAMNQLSMAGVIVSLPEQITRERAIARVRDFVLARGLPLGDRSLDIVRAERVSVGWRITLPTVSGNEAGGVFYVADDDVLEYSSSTVAPSVYLAEFEHRFDQRQGGVQV
ncbi:hypothetical protein V7968_31640 [Nocardia vulneris]|uniref:hypothetical protein n=1 Tax=Nocardia vulneris TaxID=1141657 RepID=UPI0030CC4562